MLCQYPAHRGSPISVKSQDSSLQVSSQIWVSHKTYKFGARAVSEANRERIGVGQEKDRLFFSVVTLALKKTSCTS